MPVIEKPNRIRSRKHLAFVGRFSCFVCKRHGVQVHHIQFAQPRARGLKTGDQFTIPLCVQHHAAVHNGNERKYWEAMGLDPIKYANDLWAMSCEEVK